jgi:hypothetical protein
VGTRVSGTRATAAAAAGSRAAFLEDALAALQNPVVVDVAGSTADDDASNAQKELAEQQTHTGQVNLHLALMDKLDSATNAITKRYVLR